MNDPYRTLGVPYDASFRTIRTAARRLFVQHHPDRNGGTAEANRRLRELLEAYKALETPEARAKTDAHRARLVREAKEAWANALRLAKARAKKVEPEATGKEGSFADLAKLHSTGCTPRVQFGWTLAGVAVDVVVNAYAAKWRAQDLAGDERGWADQNVIKFASELMNSPDHQARPGR